jgi:hypothetical protein
LTRSLIDEKWIPDNYLGNDTTTFGKRPGGQTIRPFIHLTKTMDKMKRIPPSWLFSPGDNIRGRRGAIGAEPGGGL